MRTSKNFLWLGLIAIWVTACQLTSAGPVPVQPATSVVPATSPVQPTAVEVPATPTSIPTSTPAPTPTSTPAATDSVRQVTVLYTNDEHGWMAGMDQGQSAANLMALWRETEGYTEDGPFLLLSGGDMWTGPAISTWFEGQSMVEVMNAMGYDAAAVGNHEFDFGLDALHQRSMEAEFPFLSANLRYQQDGQTPTDIGVLPYVIAEVNGLRIGIIGLTTTSTPFTTNPINVTAFDFLDYETALRQVVPEVEAKGVDLIFVPGHICMDELAPLAEAITDLNIDLLGGGHCNELVAQEINGIILLEGGFHLTTYAKATFWYDTANDMVVDVEYAAAYNRDGMVDLGIDQIITRWQDEAETELNQVIGYTDHEIPHRSQELQDLVVDAWLYSYPIADVAITNLGGLRAPIPSGEITLADVVGVMPFDNTIVDVELTGAELMDVIIAGGSPVIGGITQESAQWILDKTGQPIEADKSYHVLVNNFMYAGGDNYGLLAEYDPIGYDTGIHWRQPVIDWIIDQASSEAQPLEIGN